MGDPSTNLILYDIATKRPFQCLSQNTWKIRLALNYKSIPYTTRWIAYPQITPYLKSLGIPPNDPAKSFFEYSCPAITLPTGEHVMETSNILPALEALQPEPSLHIDSGYLERINEIVDHIDFVRPLMFRFLWRTPDWWFEAEDAAWYHATREKNFGRTLYEIAEEEPDEKATQEMERRLGPLRDVLGENLEGPYCMGKEASFADFVLVGIMKFCRMIDQDGDVYGRLMRFDRRFRELEEACEEWCQRNDH